jgi:DnaJ-domain-containing protein 1
VDSFIDKLADFIKSLRGNDSPGTGPAPGSPEGTRFRDPDIQEAWEELDEFMRTGSNTPRDGQASHRAGARASQARPSGPDESLRQDYANLEVAFGADMATVRASYKRLVLKYHPDRQAGDPELQKVALEITKKINQSFERIRAYHEKTNAS